MRFIAQRKEISSRWMRVKPNTRREKWVLLSPYEPRSKESIKTNLSFEGKIYVEGDWNKS